MRTILLSIIIFSFMHFQCLGQNVVIGGSESGYSIFLEFVVHPGATLYSISKMTGSTISEIRMSADIENNDLKVGDHISIPLSTEFIQKYQIESAAETALSYRVKKGDNMFRIARAFNQSVQDIKKWNQKRNVNLDIGEILVVGAIGSADMTSVKKPSRANIEIAYMAPRQWQISKEIINKIKFESRFKIPEESKSPVFIVSEKGIAYRQGGQYAAKGLIVMHPSARINSKISLFNPMLNRKVEATVVGELPKQSYPEDISVVISPSVANALGALDRKFLVEITYVE